MRFLLSNHKVVNMKTDQYLLIVVLVIFGAVSLPSVYATPTVEILMEKTTFTYCEKLFYTIQISEVTGEPAIIHIRDQAGTEGSPVSIPIHDMQNPIPAPFPFERNFPTGKYFIDVEYAGAKDSAEFDLIDSENICISMPMKQVAYSWINDQMSDGFFIDAINKFVDKNLIIIPDKINEKNLENIHIPKWVKNIVGWWLEEKISDNEFSHAIQYLINKEIIVI